MKRKMADRKRFVKKLCEELIICMWMCRKVAYENLSKLACENGLNWMICIALLITVNQDPATIRPADKDGYHFRQKIDRKSAVIGGNRWNL